jgi:type I restriction enzyme S subunit
MTQQQICIGDILEPFEELLGERPEPELLTLTEKKGFIAQSQKYNKRVARDDTSDYKVIRRFDLAFNPYLLWAGAIAQNIDWDIALISPLYPTFHVRNGYDPRFIDYLLRGDSLRLRYDTISFGSVPRKRRASVTDFLNLKLPKPPSLSKQQYIADVLDRAEALRTKRRATIVQLDELVQSLFIDMFGDPVTNTKGWSRIKLEELIVTGPQNGLYKPASDYGSGVPILRIDAFYDGQVTKLSTLKRLRISDEELNLYKLSPGDIVINRVNSMEYLGKSAIIPDLDEPIVFESNMMRFSVDQNEIEPQYLVQFLQTNFIKGQIMNSAKHAVNQSSINQKDVKSFQVNVPPLPLQKEFIRRVEAINKLKSTHQASLAELDELFASLQYRAFRGELGSIPEIDEQSSKGVKI